MEGRSARPSGYEMTVPTVACNNCGKPFTTDDLRGTHCKYCGTLLAHHARAQQQVAVVKEMLADRNGNGIPDAFEGLVANAQANATNQAFGVGQPFGQPMPGPMYPMMPPTAHIQVASVHVAKAVTRTVSAITIVVVVIIAISMLALVGGIVAFFVLAGA